MPLVLHQTLTKEQFTDYLATIPALGRENTCIYILLASEIENPKNRCFIMSIKHVNDYAYFEDYGDILVQEQGSRVNRPKYKYFPLKKQNSNCMECVSIAKPNNKTDMKNLVSSFANHAKSRYSDVNTIKYGIIS